MLRLTISMALCALSVTGALARPSGEARAWAHLCPWNALNNLSHNRRDFPLGLGMETQPGMAPRTEPQYLRDYIYECLSAAEADLDAFALDIIVSQPLENWAFAVDGYLKAAETVTAETGRPFYIAPCLDSPHGRSVTELTEYVAQLMRGRIDSPAWPRYGGRPVVWTYAGADMPPDQWASLLDGLARKGLYPLIILDANSLLTMAKARSADGTAWEGLPLGQLDALAELPVALYLFRTDCDVATFERCLAYLRARRPESVAAQLSIGTIWPGYWSLGSGWYVNPQGTGLVRQTFERFARARWLTVTTWNDFYETTHFQPSIGFGSGRLDLLHALLGQWRGDRSWPPQPRVYLWQPNEVQAGDAINAQVLCLAPPDTAPIEARVSQCDATGALSPLATDVEPPAWTALSGAGVRSADFVLGPVIAAPTTCQYLLLEVRLPGQPEARQLSQPICVWPAGYHPLATPRGTLWRLGDQAQGPQQVRLDMDGHAPKGLQVTWPDGELPAGSRLLVRHNFNLIHFPGEASSPVAYDMSATYGEGRAPWEVYHPVPPWQRWGFLDTVVVLPDGALRWSEPRWVPPAPGADLECAGWWPMDDCLGVKARDLSPYGHTATFSGDPKWVTPGRVGQYCLRFDGDDDALSLPGGRFPPGPFTFRAWVKPEGDSRYDCIFAEINGCLVLSRHQVQRATPGGLALIPCERSIANDRWTRVAVVYDLTGLYLFANGELVGSTPCTGFRSSNVTALACNPFGSGSDFFKGCLDDVSIEARALSVEEILRDAAQ